MRPSREGVRAKAAGVITWFKALRLKASRVEPTKAFDLLDGGVMGRLVDYLSALIVRIGGDRCTNSCGDIAP